jgi:hypothetical protein
LVSGRFSNGLTPYCSDALGVSCGAQDGVGVEAGGVFAVPIVAAAVEGDGGYAGPGEEVEDMIVPGGEVSRRRGQAAPVS